jgi:hypothetical protein
MSEENGDSALARIAAATSHYGALGLSQSASEEDVKRAYQRAVGSPWLHWSEASSVPHLYCFCIPQAKACHPDRNSGDAAQKAFIRVQEAWDVLKVRFAYWD